MDFLNTRTVYFNGEEHFKAYYEGDLVWSKMEGTINIDHARDRDGAIEGIYDKDNKGFIIYGGQAEIKSIIINTYPKSDYREGERFNTSGLSLRVNYSDGSYKVISDGFTTNIASGKTLTKADTLIEVSYQNFKTTFTIKVDDKLIEEKTRTERTTIRFSTIKTVNNYLLPGQRKIIRQGVNGYTIKTYKDTYENGVLIKTELINKKTVNPVDQIEEIGPKADVCQTGREQCDQCQYTSQQCYRCLNSCQTGQDALS